MGSTRRDHVVDDEDLAAIHLADELARLDAGAADPALAHEGHRQRERRASRLCELHRSEIGGDDDLTAATQRRKAFEQGGECAECLGRKRRSSFEAGRVGVHDDKPIGTRRFQQLGGKASPDRPARMAAVLARVADIGHEHPLSERHRGGGAAQRGSRQPVGRSRRGRRHPPRGPRRRVDGARRQGSAPGHTRQGPHRAVPRPNVRVLGSPNPRRGGEHSPRPCAVDNRATHRHPFTTSKQGAPPSSGDRSGPLRRPR